MKKDALGIDVSKKTFDVYLHQLKLSNQFNNNKEGYKSLVKWLKTNKLNPNEVLICMEHTGLYSLVLAMFFTKKKIDFCMIPGLEIKKSIGIARGKNDLVDAKRIAEYTWLRREKLEPTVLAEMTMLVLKKQLSLRDKLVKQRAGYKASVNEYKDFLQYKNFADIIKSESRMIKVLDKEIKALEEKIKKLINDDDNLKKLYKLVLSVKGIGFVVATNLIATTNGFLNFKDSRKYACYAGIAPFPNQSGTSIKGGDKVSQIANKNIKRLLFNAAMSAVQHDPELRKYWNRKLKEGKAKMSVLNAVKNKLVQRVFAVVKRGTPYVELKKYAY